MLNHSLARVLAVAGFFLASAAACVGLAADPAPTVSAPPPASPGVGVRNLGRSAPMTVNPTISVSAPAVGLRNISGDYRRPFG